MPLERRGCRSPLYLGPALRGGSQISSAFLEHSARILTVLVWRGGVSGGCPLQLHDSRFQVKFQVVGFPDPRLRSSRLSCPQVQVPRAFRSSRLSGPQVQVLRAFRSSRLSGPQVQVPRAFLTEGRRLCWRPRVGDWRQEIGSRSWEVEAVQAEAPQMVEERLGGMQGECRVLIDVA